MAKTDKQPPFYESVMHLTELSESKHQPAIDKVQGVYASFKKRNEALVVRQNTQQNSTQIALITHFALLATLTLTVAGFLMTQTNVQLTTIHKNFIIFILLSEISSLFFGAYDFIQTIRFHQQWAHVYDDIGKEVDNKFESGELQWLKQLNEIEEKHLRSQPAQTKMWVTYCTVACSLFGLLLLLILFYGFFFNVPIIK